MNSVLWGAFPHEMGVQESGKRVDILRHDAVTARPEPPGNARAGVEIPHPVDGQADRFEQEMVYLVQKMDVDEELDRLFVPTIGSAPWLVAV